jgi:sulfatase maturation enzyme AslB (radical SAM superfamily)
VAPPQSSEGFPRQPLLHLDALWIQVAGTLCNLECRHCFVSSGPHNRRHPMMARAAVARRVAEALALGVREFYFTGGEPFLHPELLEILRDTLRHGPCTVLTNGVLLTRARLAVLRALSDVSRYSLELRVSLDGWQPEAHDRVRGAGSFARVLQALRDCAAHDLLPIVTVTYPPDEDPLRVLEPYLDLLRGAGIERPRIKSIPLFRLGREAARSGPYTRGESLAGAPPERFPDDRLLCASARAVTSRGVHVCPLLVDEPGSRMGGRLAEALGPFALAHGACYTCHVTGMTCGN